MPTTLVSELMTPAPHTIAAGKSIEDADRLLRKHHIRHLPVVAHDGKLLGVVSDHDLEWLRAASELAPACIPVEKALRGPMLTVEPGVRVLELVRAMIDQKAGSAVVVEHGKVVGVITTGDGLRLLAQVLERKSKAPQTP